jgi:predicted unusual protein kinase regulating ubiquinone biosynthesis (AarF/ABC1/UbiB family)
LITFRFQKFSEHLNFITTGAKIGTNYLKHYGKKLITSDVSREELHLDNANDIYNSLSELKGGALKVAQMLSMDKNLLPQLISKSLQWLSIAHRHCHIHLW